ncbi:MAG: thiamine pyrophosphate-dependent dehydrogenase E1 component subunit alpha [Acidobacteria bacterium]|nr:thiamine pyrophosphate-dependent dehydrogenase E1 component subunit alpha [Acidobacteriota bacterium]
MKNGSANKSGSRKEAKGAGGKGQGENGTPEALGAAAGATKGQPFVTVEPPRVDGLAEAADPLNEQGELICTSETTLEPGQLLELYRHLQLTRLVEEKLVNLYRQTKIVGGVFRSLGQEATAVGTAYALRREDFIAPLIRDLGAVLVKGIRPREIFAQYMAKAWGPSEGRDLNIHFGNLEKGFIGPISHLGDMIPVMTGIVLAARMQKKESVAVAYIGDGGMSTGAFHEGLNFAAVQRLPLIVVAEHNWYAYSTPTSKQTAVKHLAEKAAGYGIPGHIVDGNDVVACYEVMRQSAEFARGGGGAVLVEAKTYRRKGHAEHDDQRYLPEGEIEAWEKRDPLDRFTRHLLSNGVATQAKLDGIVSDVRREIEEDSAWAESSPMPEPEKAAYNVFDNTVVPPAFRPPLFGGNE